MKGNLTRGPGRRQTSGWHMGEARKRAGVWIAPPGPSAWEETLRELGMPEAMALPSLLDGNAPRLRRWIQREVTRRYVPEEIVAALGLTERAERSAGLSVAAMHLAPARRALEEARA